MRFKKVLAPLAGAFFLAVVTPSSAQDTASQILFTNVDVFDSRNATVINGANVLIQDNLIAEVTTEALTVDGATVIDGEGRMLVPGLIDGHNHIMLPGNPLALAYNLHWSYIEALVTREAEAMLMRGFTTLRDAGGPVTGSPRP